MQQDENTRQSQDSNFSEEGRLNESSLRDSSFISIQDQATQDSSKAEF